MQNSCEVIQYFVSTAIFFVSFKKEPDFYQLNQTKKTSRTVNLLRRSMKNS